MSLPTKPKAIIDEDVEDLDDILDEFHAPAPAATSSKSAAVPSPSTSSAATKAAAPVQPSDGDAFNADFAEEFARQMEEALREMGGGGPAASSTASAGGSTDGNKEQEEAFKKAWERILVDGLNGTGLENPKEETFQQNIRDAQERLKASDANLQATAASVGDDDLKKLLDSLGDPNMDEDLQGILEGMMGQLMSKDVLYDPLKELNDKFPAYLKENASTLKDEDKKRYDAQITTITKILAVFDDPTFKDEDPEKSAEIVALMSEMQSYGSPPEELMGPLPPGMGLGSDGMPNPDDCKMQ